MDPTRLSSPLDAERDAIRRLSEYTTADDLADAIRRVEPAIDRVLRLMLREDRSAPDDVRLTALSSETPAEEVVASLRRADTITMELAASLAQLRDAAGRARGGTVTAADADVARHVLRELAAGRAAGALPAAATEPSAADPEPVMAPPPGRGGRTLLIAAILVGVGGAAIWLARRGQAPSAEAGVAAFAAGRIPEAEQIFRARTEAGSGDVTDWLFLGRIYRRMGRYQEAGGALRTAVDADPADADVRRELGWLFMDLGRPASAADQFRLAVEQARDEPLNWIGLIRALRAAGDPSAADWLERAPAGVRSRLDSVATEPPVSR